MNNNANLLVYYETTKTTEAAIAAWLASSVFQGNLSHCSLETITSIINYYCKLRHLLVSFETTKSIGAPRSLARIICYLRKFTVSVRLASTWLLNKMVSYKGLRTNQMYYLFAIFFYNFFYLSCMCLHLHEPKKCITTVKNEVYSYRCTFNQGAEKNKKKNIFSQWPGPYPPPSQ